MKVTFLILMIICISISVNSQRVQRVTSTDVLEAKAHPQCSNGQLAIDEKFMPETTNDDVKVATYMRQFRAYRDNTNHSPNMLIHFKDDSFRSDARIRDVTPSY